MSRASANSTPSSGRRGRPLDPARDAAILSATLEGLADVGYDRLSMDEIAARAHVGKAALYRRWPSKAALMVDAVVAWRNQFGPVDIPDTGSLRGDLDALLDQVPNFDQAARRQMGVLLGLAGAASRDAELRSALGPSLLARPRLILGTVLTRAAERGEIADGAPLELLPDILIGLNTVRVLQGQFPDREFVRGVLDDVLYPLATGRRLTDS